MSSALGLYIPYLVAWPVWIFEKYAKIPAFPTGILRGYMMLAGRGLYIVTGSVLQHQREMHPKRD